MIGGEFYQALFLINEKWKGDIHQDVGRLNALLKFLQPDLYFHSVKLARHEFPNFCPCMLMELIQVNVGRICRYLFRSSSLF